LWRHQFGRDPIKLDEVMDWFVRMGERLEAPVLRDSTAVLDLNSRAGSH
jgi:hypothetical protein